MRTRPITYLAAAALLLSVWSCAAPPKPPVVPAPEPVPGLPAGPPSVGPLGTGKLYGTITFSGNNTAPLPVRVRVRGRYVESEGGNYVLTGMPEGQLRVVAEARGGGKRYLALEKAVLREGQEKKLDLRLGDASDIDRYCAECHPYRGEKVGPGQRVRDTHKSGFLPRKQMRSRELLDRRGYVTCESCHTAHEDTAERFFMRYPYMNGDLCNRCH